MIKKILFVLLTVFIITPGFCAGYTIKKLPSGQTVIVSKISRNPTVMIDTWIRTGSSDEDETNSGVAHFLEHLFFKGTEKNPTGVFDNLIESKGGITNAATSKDFTHYYINIPSKDFDLALSLHSDMLLNPMIPRKELEKERLVVLEEISKNLDSPQNIAYNNLFKSMYFENSPYYRPVIGSEKVIQNITRDDILKFYDAHYMPSNMVTVIVGDIDEGETIKKVEEAFRKDEDNAIPQKKKPKMLIPKQKTQNRITEEKDIQQSYMLIGYRTLKFSDNKDLYALDILSEILGGGQSSRLVQKLKKQKDIVQSVSSGSSNMVQDGIFLINASFNPKNLEIVENDIYEEIEKIKEGDFSEKDIEKAKNVIETDTYYSRESISNIANELGYLSILNNNTGFYDNYLKNIKKVTKNDVIKTAKKYLDKNNSVVSLVMPKNYKSNEEKSKSEEKSYSGKILEQNDKVIKYELENKAKLIIEKNLNNSIIAISIQARGGDFQEIIPGISTIAARVAKEGTKNFTGKELSEKLDEKGIKISLASGADTFKINLLTTKNELQNALYYLNEIINNPLFKQDEIDKAKNSIIQGIKSLSDNPTAYGMDTFRGEAFDTPYNKNSKIIRNNIDKITKKDIEDYYRKILSSQNIDIAVVGDVNEQEMINYFSKTFRKTSDNTVSIKNLEYTPGKIEKNITKSLAKDNLNTSWIFLGYKTTSIYNESDIATLHVINAILGEGMSSRLFRNLRDNEGLAYAVGSTMIQNALDGVFLAYIGTNPDKIEQSKNGILNEFQKLKTEFVTKKELNEAKDKILGNLVISLETNMDEAGLLSWYLTTGRDINFLETYKKNIQNVTPSDILDVANKYFDKPYIMTIVKP